MQNAKKFWDKAAKKYSRSTIKDKAAYEYTLGRIKAYLKKTDNVLEIGCGTGSTALLLADGVSQFTASDLSGEMIEIARAKAKDQGVENTTFIASDMFNDADIQGTYDVLLALNLLHLVEDTSAALERINNLVKPEGYFISKTVCKPAKGAPLKFRIMLPLIPLMQWLGMAPFVKFLTPATLETMITDAGFSIVEAGDHPHPSRFIVAQKKTSPAG